MSNSNFRPPNSGVKQFNALPAQREEYELRKETTPGAGPLTMTNPNKVTQVNMTPFHFLKLKAILGKK